MSQGRIVQVDTPKQLYERPRTTYVADFVGKVNLFPARVVEVAAQTTVLELTDDLLADGGSRRVVAATPTDFPVGAAVQVGVRPEYLTIQREAAAQNCVAGRVESIKFVGPVQYFSLQVGAERSVLALDPTKGEAGADLLYASWPPEKTLILSESES
jgi:ABC-type Fe3+/spermidine/putrescine transport system ATPase subunit